MRKINIISIIIVMMVLLLSFGTSKIFVQANSIPFSVEPILPDNQDKETKSYISVSPKGKSLSQEFQFQLTNLSNETKEIKINIVDAYSSPNGVIQYVNEASENSEIVNEQYKLSNYLTADNDIVTINSGETKIISTKIDVDHLEGVLLGGVSFTVVEEGEEIIQSENTFQINNEINMVIGVLVNFETTEDATFIIDEPFIDPMPAYYAIRLPITLEAPVLQQDVLIKYEVKHKDVTLFTNEKNLNFAPFTKTNVSIPYEHNEIARNESYTIIGELIYQNSQGDKISDSFEKTFQYEKEKETNNEIGSFSPPIEKGSFPSWLFILFVIPLVIIPIIIRKKKKLIKSTENQ